MSTEDNGISGEWRGSYGYRDGRLGVNFEANFTVTSELNHFSGTITDDGPGGDAQVTGQQIGDTLRFTKFYISPLTDTMTAPVLYEGTLSPDGQSLSGQWTLKSLFIVSRGPWQATRVANDSQENRATRFSTVWPVLPDSSFAPAQSYTDSAMTSRRLGGKLTLTKKNSPTMVGQKRGLIMAIAMPLIWLTIVLGVFLPQLLRGPLAGSFFIWKGFIVGCFGVIALGALAYRWWRIYLIGDEYILDRDTNKLIRNSKLIGKVNDINHVQVNKSPRGGNMYTVKLVMNDGRRIYVETGEQQDTLSLANEIGGFVGVGVVSKT